MGNTCLSATSAAASAESSKQQNYSDLSMNYIFEPVAFEMRAVWSVRAGGLPDPGFALDHIPIVISYNKKIQKAKIKTTNYATTLIYYLGC
jgi:hypothetical protein